MWLCVQLFLPVHLFAQDPARQGRWDQLYFLDPQRNEPPKVVVWRYNAAEWSDQDQARGDYVPDGAWRRVYGIHAALLPLTGDTLQHGWVILWGYGHTNTSLLRVRREVAEPYYFGSLFFGNPGLDYFLDPVAITPVLFWYPVAPPMDPFYARSVAYGYVRYLFDSDAWNPLTPTWPVYDLFCAGHAFLPDGRLFIAGGNTSLRTSVGEGRHAGLRLFTVLQNQWFQRGDVREELGRPDRQGVANRL